MSSPSDFTPFIRRRTWKDDRKYEPRSPFPQKIKKRRNRRTRQNKRKFLPPLRSPYSTPQLPSSNLTPLRTPPPPPPPPNLTPLRTPPPLPKNENFFNSFKLDTELLLLYFQKAIEFMTNVHLIGKSDPFMNMTHQNYMVDLISKEFLNNKPSNDKWVELSSMFFSIKCINRSSEFNFAASLQNFLLVLYDSLTTPSTSSSSLLTPVVIDSFCALFFLLMKDQKNFAFFHDVFHETHLLLDPTFRGFNKLEDERMKPAFVETMYHKLTYILLFHIKNDDLSFKFENHFFSYLHESSHVYQDISSLILRQVSFSHFKEAIILHDHFIVKGGVEYKEYSNAPFLTVERVMNLATERFIAKSKKPNSYFYLFHSFGVDPTKNNDQTKLKDCFVYAKTFDGRFSGVRHLSEITSILQVGSLGFFMNIQSSNQNSERDFCFCPFSFNSFIAYFDQLGLSFYSTHFTLMKQYDHTLCRQPLVDFFFQFPTSQVKKVVLIPFLTFEDQKHYENSYLFLKTGELVKLSDYNLIKVSKGSHYKLVHRLNSRKPPIILDSFLADTYNILKRTQGSFFASSPITNIEPLIQKEQNVEDDEKDEHVKFVVPLPQNFASTN